MTDCPLRLAVVCPDCGPYAAVDVDGTWHEADSWLYLARIEHDRTNHPERKGTDGNRTDRPVVAGPEGARR